MLNTGDWVEQTVEVLKDISLDPRNVRLEATDSAVDADLMADLFANEDVLSLVESICTTGYLTHETPVALMRNGQLVMVEGNRRLAALKAIQNPLLVPEYEARVRALTRQVSDLTILRRIRVLVAPSQDQADELIANIHTGNLRRAWNPARQAAFFQTQVQNGQTLPALLARYPRVDVRRFFFAGLFLNQFYAVRLKDPALTDFLKSARGRRSNTTLARIYETAPFRSLTGFELTEQGKLKKSITQPVFARMVEIIVRGLMERELDTRSLNKTTAPRFEQLMRELALVKDGGKAPAAVKSSSGTSAGQRGAAATHGKQSPASASGKSGSASQGQQPKRRRQQLELQHITVPVDYPVGVRLLVAELSAINVENLPNVAHLTIRAVLEKSIKSYAEHIGADIAATNNTQGRVQLSDALLWLLKRVKQDAPHLRDSVESVRTGNLVSYGSTKKALDASNHNHHFSVQAADAFGAWSSIDPIMRYLMSP